MCSVAPIFVCNPYKVKCRFDDRRAGDSGPLRCIRQPCASSPPAQAQPKRHWPWDFRWAQYPPMAGGVPPRMATNLAGVSAACAAATPASAWRSARQSSTPWSNISTPLRHLERIRRLRLPPPAALERKDSPFRDTRRKRSTGEALRPPALRPCIMPIPRIEPSGTGHTEDPTVTEVASTLGAHGEPIIDVEGSLAGGGSRHRFQFKKHHDRVSNSGLGNAIDRRPDGRMDDERVAGGRQHSRISGQFQRKGEWACADYWAINHPARPARPTSRKALGGVCGEPAARQRSVAMDDYRYEIAQGTGSWGIAGWSGRNGWATEWPGGCSGRHEPGGQGRKAALRFAPARAGVGGGGPTTGGVDRRNLIVPIINCLAQTALGNIAGASATSAASGRIRQVLVNSALQRAQ